jgi:hypothetical protein
MAEDEVQVVSTKLSELHRLGSFCFFAKSFHCLLDSGVWNDLLGVFL